MAKSPRINSRNQNKNGDDPHSPRDVEQSPSAFAWDRYVREFNRRAVELRLPVNGPRTLGALVHGRYPISPPGDAERADFFASLIDEMLPSSLARCAELAGELGRISAQRQWGAHKAATQRKSNAAGLAETIRRERDELIAQGRAPSGVATILATRHELTPQRVRQILRQQEKRK